MGDPIHTSTVMGHQLKDVSITNGPTRMTTIMILHQRVVRLMQMVRGRRSMIVLLTLNARRQASLRIIHGTLRRATLVIRAILPIPLGLQDRRHRPLFRLPKARCRQGVINFPRLGTWHINWDLMSGLLRITRRIIMTNTLLLHQAINTRRVLPRQISPLDGGLHIRTNTMEIIHQRDTGVPTRREDPSMKAVG